ncbi:hypothetical protein FHB02_10990 [Escherichia coli]|nr:hypothetical protein [Escherichia coli]HAV9242764.1 hypothetical protein [Escherichia coli]HAW0881835.1 hypothetical protein [Escherichia coli]HAW8209204.1 hypothetical protein [Escherichia coli]
MDVMRSVLGMVVLLTIAFLLSVNKKKISLRTVGALKKSLLACIK